MKFVFDLDGTITKRETLPLIARRFGLESEINELTVATIRGNIPFIESFIRRVGILGQQSVEEIHHLLASVDLFEGVVQFIALHRESCIVATGNLDVWVKGICDRLGCQVVTSEAEVVDDRVTKLRKILKKDEIVKELQAAGETVVFIGDGNNDAEAMRLSDYSIASGLIHWPARSVMDVTDFAVFDEVSLLRLLNMMADSGANTKGDSLVLSCAGIGSRLGLNSTKALINFAGKPHIQWQIANFSRICDVRVVVGFQAQQVIEAVLEVRKDIIFVFNHEYFTTGTGYSLFLGSRFSCSYVLAWDGDLVVHSDYLDACLDAHQEYLGISQAVTDDAVRVSLDDDGVSVTGFSREFKTAFEWSGPARLRRDRIKPVRGNVFEGLIEALPLPALHIKAFDIDTPKDYQYAIDHYEAYSSGK